MAFPELSPNIMKSPFYKRFWSIRFPGFPRTTSGIIAIVGYFPG